jgi:hypothetical protein
VSIASARVYPGALFWDLGIGFLTAASLSEPRCLSLIDTAIEMPIANALIFHLSSAFSCVATVQIVNASHV